MKYLFLIIRHCFPRSRWTIISTRDVADELQVVIGQKYILRDQFGNLKIVKTY